MTGDVGFPLFWGAFLVLLGGWPMGLFLGLAAMVALFGGRLFLFGASPPARHGPPPDDFAEWASQ